MFRKEDVRFPADGGIVLSAWLFIPECRATPRSGHHHGPSTMAHGYAGTDLPCVPHSCQGETKVA
jgi:uncharacterized protein